MNEILPPIDAANTSFRVQRELLRSQVKISCSLSGNINWYYVHPNKTYNHPKSPHFSKEKILNIPVVHLWHTGYYFCATEFQGKGKVFMEKTELRVYG